MSSNKNSSKEALKYLNDFMQNIDRFENVNVNDYLFSAIDYDSRRIDDCNIVKKISADIVKEGKRLKYLMPATKDSVYVNLTDLGQDVHFAGGHYRYLNELKEKKKKPHDYYTNWITAITTIFSLIFGVWKFY